MTKHDKVIDQQGNEVLDPKRALSEQTLAVDLAGVEIDRAIATAHKYPRSIDTVVKKISTLACYNEESAATCVYSLPRGSKPIIGPSIGFANIVLQSWGNCRAASQIVYIDTKQKVVIAQGAFMDLETNAQSIVPVNRRIVDKNGRLFNDDMQIVTGMAAASIARRNAILQGVPRGIWFQVWQDALNIVRGTVETFAERKDKAIKAMAQFGVKPEQIWMYLGLKGEPDMTFEHIPFVRGMYQQLRDGAISVEEMFDPRRMTGKGFETVENPLGDGLDEGAGGVAQGQQSTAAESDEAPGGDEAPVTATGAAPDKPAAGSTPPAGAAQVTPKAENAPTGSAGAAAPAANEAPKASEAPKPADAKPRDPAGYLVAWEGFLDQATSLAAIQQRWGQDRDLRGVCSVIGEHLDRAKKLRADREAEIRAESAS